MPAPVAQHGLSKPKSKLRLRLGLTPPHPKPTLQPLRTQPSNVNLAHQAQLAKEVKDEDKSRSSNTTSPPSTAGLTAQSYLNTSTATSISSQMTTLTLSSRGDSRDAFALDTSPHQPRSPYSPPFDDVVSYSTVSPASAVPSSSDPYHLDDYDRSVAARGRHEREVDYRSENKKYCHEDNLDSSDTSPSIQIHQPDHSYIAHHDYNDEEISHPLIHETTTQTDDTFSLTDQQLSDRFTFIEEIGFGNWGSVWLCKPKHIRSSAVNDNRSNGVVVKLGRAAAASGGSGAGGKVAVKLVHRSKNSTTAARVRALWGEMKIIRSLKHEPHPSIIQFEAFVITPSYALVIMPHLPQLIPVQLPVHVATPYFRQLASAIGYLHERGITHNDIKPANVLLSHNDVPVLVDFGFANQWDVAGRGSFLSSISWGTPEYLDPQRAMGMPHDERASDVWSLGITMFEILIGRTPFEESEEEEFATPDELLIYYERTKRGIWLGEWDIPDDMTHLLRSMINPDPASRVSAMQAYHHPALQPVAPSVIITPHFVRAAASFDMEDEPIPTVPISHNVTHRHHRKLEDPSTNTNYHVEHDRSPRKDTAGTTKEALAKSEAEKKRRKKRKDMAAKEVSAPRSATPTPALGESIKQHTSVGRPHAVAASAAEKHVSGVRGIKVNSAEVEAAGGKGKLVIRKSRDEMLNARNSNDGDEEDPTPTKVVKPAQPLRIKELTADKKIQPRTSNSQLTTLSRPTSNNLNATKPKVGEGRSENSNTDSTATVATQGHRVSALSTTSSATSVPAKTKEEAVQKAMKHLEGGNTKRRHHHERDVLGAIKRPAPPAPSVAGIVEETSVKPGPEKREPIRPRSLDSARGEGGKQKIEDMRRSLTLEKRALVGVSEEIEGTVAKEAVVSVMTSPKSESTKRRTIIETSIPSPTVHIEIDVRPTTEWSDDYSKDSEVKKVDNSSGSGKIAFPASDLTSPLAELRERIINADRENLVRFRTTSGDLLPTPRASSDEARKGKTSLPVENVAKIPSAEALAMDSRLDKIATWAKTVERIIEEARQALAEGREPPLPPLNLPSELLNGIPNLHSVPPVDPSKPERQFGLTPNNKPSLPAHLRTSSTQVEPSTPPKWMTYAEAVDRVLEANGGLQVAEAPVLNGVDSGKRVVREKKERPSVAHVLKLFGAGDKDKDKAASRSNTPEPSHTVLLKNPQLRGAPSTPALRSSTTARRVPARKSESNLRNFATMPTIPSPVALENYTQAQAQMINGSSRGYYTLYPDPYTGENEDVGGESTRQVVYEQLLETTPGIARDGQGWTSRLAPPPVGQRMTKPSSMASLRERAKAWIRDDRTEHLASVASGSQGQGIVGSGRGGRNIVDLSKEVDDGSSNGGTERRYSNSNRLVSTFSVSTTGAPGTGGMTGGRPATPALTLGTMKSSGEGKVRGFFRGFRNAVGGRN